MKNAQQTMRSSNSSDRRQGLTSKLMNEIKVTFTGTPISDISWKELKLIFKPMVSIVQRDVDRDE